MYYSKAFSHNFQTVYLINEKSFDQSLYEWNYTLSHIGLLVHFMMPWVTLKGQIKVIEFVCLLC